VLGGIKIGDEGARYIGEVLQQNEVSLYFASITII